MTRTATIRLLSALGRSLLIKAGILAESYELIVPTTKPIAGQTVKVGSDAKQLEWATQTASAEVVHGHVVADITGLQNSLNNLATAIGSKANSSDLTAIATAIDDLTLALTQKAALTHTHSDYAPIVHLHSDKSDITHTHSTFAASVHAHIIDNVTDLAATLALKSPTTHTHTLNLAAPGPIGATTPGTGKFTTVTITSNANNIGADTGSFQCLGGAYIARNVLVGASLTVADAFKHTGVAIGFYNSPAVNKQVVTGSKTGNQQDVMNSLVLALKNYGLITDSRSA
jgi:hypothetical protein